MRGILPEAVRTRIGKGAPYGRLAWASDAQQGLFESMAQDSILADLGVVDGEKLRAAIRAAQREHASRENLSGSVQTTLILEAWLRMRSGHGIGINSGIMSIGNF
jgi:hypothetical protein